MELRTDGEGFLLNRDDWNPDVAKQIAATDGIELSETQMDYIMTARAMYDRDGVVPPLRKFAKEKGIDKKDLFQVFHTGPMKLICKWGGLPKPTGCV